MAKLEKLLAQANDHLDDGESVDAAVLGTYETEILGTESVRTGILIATPRRVVFFAKKMTGYDLESFPYENISSFEQGKNFLGASITFFASGNKVHLKWIKEGEIGLFVDVVRSRMGKKPPEAAPTPGTSAGDRIRELKQLLDEGLLTQEEFDSKRQVLLKDL